MVSTQQKHRDEFSMRIKRAVSSRVALLCSNPECRSVTAGPQSDPVGTVNIGVAAHMSAAAAKGPRYNQRLTPNERKGIGNAIWLCQNCAKLIDSDPNRFAEAILLKWKRDAELEAKHNLGKRRIQARSNSSVEVKKKLALKRKMSDVFSSRSKGFEVIIHSDQDRLYPEFEEGPGISGWFKVETWGMYHDGIQVILALRYAVLSEDKSWSVVPNDRERELDQKLKVYMIGRIPYRNIVGYDLSGDEYYREPHIYCRFSDNGQPYETIVAEVVEGGYRQILEAKFRVPFEQLDRTANSRT